MPDLPDLPGGLSIDRIDPLDLDLATADALADLLTEHRTALEPADRRALLMLLQLGTRGSDMPKVPALTFLDDPAPDA